MKDLRNQRRSLLEFMRDARVPIDHNVCERAIRPIAIGRRNWLLSGSVDGAEGVPVTAPPWVLCYAVTAPSYPTDAMLDPDRHEQLITSALALHEARDYAAALPKFQQALRETPECVTAQYNVANTLHMLGRCDEATSILIDLLATDDGVFLKGCPLEEDPAPLKLDALFLVFLTTLHDTESWDAAFPYAESHLKARTGGLKSVFSDEYVQTSIESLRDEFQS